MAEDPDHAEEAPGKGNNDDFEFGNFEDAAVTEDKDGSEEQAAPSEGTVHGPQESEENSDTKGGTEKKQEEQHDDEESSGDSGGRRPPFRKSSDSNASSNNSSSSNSSTDKDTDKPKTKEQEKPVEKEISLVDSATNTETPKEEKICPSKVEAEVCEAFFEWTSAWNSGDLVGYLDAYWDSEQTRYISDHLADIPHSKGSVVVTGRHIIDKIFTDIFVKNKKQQEKQRNKKGVAGNLTLRKLIVTPAGNGGDHAIVYGEHQLELAGDKKGTSRGGVFTIHVQKIKGVWKIISEHATALPKK